MRQSKGGKLKEWLKQYWPVIVALIITPVVLGILMPFINIDNGSDDGWLGFWGGYFASIITIVGVFWQVRKQINADKEKERINKRPAYIALRYNWNINTGSKVALFNDMAFPNPRNITKNFTDASRLKGHYIPMLINATDNDLYNVIIFGSFEKYMKTSSTHVDDESVIVKSEVDTLAFPLFTRSTNLQLLFEDALKDDVFTFDSPFLTLVELFGKTEAGEKVYIKFTPKTDPDPKEHLPQSMLSDMYFEFDENYPKEYVNQLLDDRSSFIVHASASTWEERKANSRENQQEQYYREQQEHLNKLIKSQRRTRRHP